MSSRKKSNLKKKNTGPEKAWILDVNMGYGHQRTSFCLKHLAPGGKVISGNDYPDIPRKDYRIWHNSRVFYEFVSRFKRVPLIGEFVFFLFDKTQKIPLFYPRRDLSQPNFYLRQVYNLLQKGWGEDLIKKLGKRKLPLITTFFIPAFMAEFFNYPGEIYCVVCDADISRSWVPLKPQESRIQYFAPNKRVVERLKLYGVKKKNIFLSGYPLPKENIGLPDPKKGMEILKKDLGYRLLNLDPQGNYQEHYHSLIKSYLGGLPKQPDHILTVAFAVGGAGAQKELAIKIVDSLSRKIREDRIKIILIAGVRKEVRDYFLESIDQTGLKSYLGRNIEIVWEKEMDDYFQAFNRALRKIDILWSKPSELSFYTGLGLPLIIAPPVGSQEDFNKRWLTELGAAIKQKSISYAEEWLFDLLDQGWFAEAAMQGFIEADNLGTFRIEKKIKELKEKNV